MDGDDESVIQEARNFLEKKLGVVDPEVFVVVGAVAASV